MENRFKIFFFVLFILLLSACAQAAVDSGNESPPAPPPTVVLLSDETAGGEMPAKITATPERVPNNDFCMEDWGDESPEEFACRLIEHIVQKELDSLATLMAGRFTLISSEQGGGGGREDPADQAVALLYDSFLPDSQDGIFFSIDPNQDRTLPETKYKPILIIFSEGWGQEGDRTASLFIALNESGEYVWYGVHIHRPE